MACSTIGHGGTSGSVCGRVDESNAESSQPRRRVNVINQAPYDPSMMKVITLNGGGFGDPKVSRMLTTILKNMFSGSWTTWKEVNETARNELWVHFKRFFQWEVVSDVLVREVWENSMKKRYPDIISKARDESTKMAQLAEVEFDGSDFSVLKPYNPKRIESSYWEDMINRVWNTAEWKTKSKSGRVKQFILKEVSKPCVGSVTIAQHKRKLEKELKTPLTITASEVFELTHTKKAVGNALHEFMKSKAELVWGAYKEAVVAKYGPDSLNHPIFDVDLWEHCSQEVTKGGLFG